MKIIERNGQQRKKNMSKSHTMKFVNSPTNTKNKITNGRIDGYHYFEAMLSCVPVSMPVPLVNRKRLDYHLYSNLYPSRGITGTRIEQIRLADIDRSNSIPPSLGSREHPSNPMPLLLSMTPLLLLLLVAM